MPREIIAITVLVALTLSGCVSNDPADPQEAPAARPALEPDAEGGEGAGIDATGAAAPPLHEEFDGALASFATLCVVPAQQCAATPSRSPTVGTRIEFEGVLVDIGAEMSWSPQGPGRDVLGLMVMTCDEETGACVDHGQVQGSSPLAITAEGVNAASNRTLFVHAFQPTQNQGAVPVIVYYELDQPFRIVIHATRGSVAP